MLFAGNNAGTVGPVTVAIYPVSAVSDRVVPRLCPPFELLVVWIYSGVYDVHVDRVLGFTYCPRKEIYKGLLKWYITAYNFCSQVACEFNTCIDSLREKMKVYAEEENDRVTTL